MFASSKYVFKVSTSHDKAQFRPITETNYAINACIL